MEGNKESLWMDMEFLTLNVLKKNHPFGKKQKQLFKDSS